MRTALLNSNRKEWNWKIEAALISHFYGTQLVAYHESWEPVWPYIELKRQLYHQTYMDKSLN